MTRDQEHRVRLWMRLAPTELVRRVVDHNSVGGTPEAVMDELWTQKAALGGDATERRI